MYALFFWAMCGVGAAIVASNKGRSAFGWLLLGFLLGPIGFVLSLVVAKNTVALEESAIRSGEMRKCQFCAELVKVEAHVCKHCGKDISAANSTNDKLKLSEELKNAIYHNKIERVKELLSLGVILDDGGSKDIDPIDYAELYDRKEILDLMRAHQESKSRITA